MYKGSPGVTLRNGADWSEQRRFALKTLRDFGFGKSVMENMIAEEVNEVCTLLEDSNESYIQMRQFFNKHMLRTLWKVLTNQDLDHQHGLEFMDVWKKIERLSDQGETVFLYIIMHYEILLSSA